jgi:hypothetical protein
MQDARNDGSKWVMKPQREGGGNNLYGQTLSNFLNQHWEDSLLEGMISPIEA